MDRWTARQSYKHPESWRVDDDRMITVAIVDDYHRDVGENERLARRIALLPELAEKLEAMVKAHGSRSGNQDLMQSVSDARGVLEKWEAI